MGVAPGAFLEGMLHIGLPMELPIAAIDTSQTNVDPNAGADAGTGIGIDVEYLLPINGLGF